MRSLSNEGLGDLLSPQAEDTPQLLQRCLRAIRTHLDMEAAFVSEFKDGRRWFRQIDQTESAALLQVGGSDPLEESYCQRVVDGRLPELIHDARQLPEALRLAATRALPVGAHLSVPLRLRDGSLYGTFCCFSRLPDPSLRARDLRLMRVLADLVADGLSTELESARQRAQARARICAAQRDGALQMVYQPIRDVSRGHVVGFEALARFCTLPPRTPDLWFAEAAELGCSAELELQAIAAALAPLARIPAPTYLSINASPSTLLHPGLSALLEGCPLERVVIEITEHAAVEHYEALVTALRPLQRRGLQLAIDDAGAGYASFRHVLNLAPQQIKLDISLTRNIHGDPSRAALAAALCSFARATGCLIVAEGIESAAELQALRELGVTRAQGFHLGRPAALETGLGQLPIQAPGSLH